MGEHWIRGVEAAGLTLHLPKMSEILIPGAPASWTRDQHLALAWTPLQFRTAVSAIFIVDAHFGHIALQSVDPILIRIKLAWWRESGIDSGSLGYHLPPEVNASLTALPNWKRHAMSLLDAWDGLVVAWPLDAQSVEVSARDRGSALAQAIAEIFGGGDAYPCVADYLSRWTAHHLGRHTHTPSVGDAIAQWLTKMGRMKRVSHLPPPVRVLARLATRTRSSGVPDVFTAFRGAVIDHIL